MPKSRAGSAHLESPEPAPPDGVRSRETDPARIRLCLLGGFDLQTEDGSESLPLPSQRVLALLGVHERPLGRSFVAATVWPDSTEAARRSNLRSALWKLGSRRGAMVEATHNTLRLQSDVVVDIRERRILARRLLDPSSNYEPVEPSPTLFESGLLPDWYDEWLEPHRESYRQLRLHALEAICDRLVLAERYDEALQAGLIAISAAPLRESGHRAIISALMAEGNRAEALRHYDRLRELLENELAIAPSFGIDDVLGNNGRRDVVPEGTGSLPLSPAPGNGRSNRPQRRAG
jgi:DNA-binding SARP family transcriptional activator